MKHLTLLIATILSFCSCSQSQKTTDFPIILNVDEFENDKDFKFSAIEFTPLETNNNCLLSDVDKIIYQNQFYYILDRKSQRIFIFSENGKYINTIHRVGQGPSEYVSIHDFDIDDENNIYVNSALSHKIIKYLYPNYLKTEEYIISSPSVELAVTNKTHRIWLANIPDYNGYKRLALYSNGESITKLEHREIFDDIARPVKPQSFYKSERSLYFNPVYSPYVYELNKEEKPIAEIRSKYFISESDFSLSQSERIQKLREKKLIEGIDFFYKINNFYVGALRGSLSVFIYDITNQNGKLINTIPIERNNILTQNGDYLISVISAEAFKQMHPEQSEDVKEDDNPILVKMKL